jgi:hypothetical protein
MDLTAHVADLQLVFGLLGEALACVQVASHTCFNHTNQT